VSIEAFYHTPSGGEKFMVHLWGSKTKDELDLSKSALGESTTGDIVVVVGGEKVDMNLIYLGCQMAKGAKRKVHLVYVIEVPRAQPLNAVLPKESERADKLLNSAMIVAGKVGCEAVAEIVQARDAGPAIVEEARDHSCSAIFIGLVRNGKNVQNDLGKTIPYVLTHACCRVWLVQDPCPQSVM